METLTSTNESRKRNLSDDSSGPSSNNSPKIDESNTTSTQEIYYPKFLIIEPVLQDGFSKLSPFAIEKAMKGIAGEVKDCKKLRSGALLVEVFRDGQSKNLLNQTTFASIQVKVSGHRSLNTCKGVVRDRDLAKMDADELVQSLHKEKVIAAQNITIVKEGDKVKTNAIILTFATPSIPTSIRAGFLVLRVTPYVPNPLRCFNCQRFGHHQTNCNRNKTCPKCGEGFHGDEECQKPLKCINCSGDHPAFYKSCPTWQKEKEICRIKATRNISYPEARKVVIGTAQNSTSKPSYAAITKSTRSIATQTEVTNCKCIPNFATNKETNKNVSTNETQTESAIDDTNDKENEKQEDTEGWDVVGRSRGKSRSPQGKQGARGGARGGRGGKPPPVKQAKGSHDPPRPPSETSASADESVEGNAPGGSQARQTPRQKIQYP
jgi:hypothetical protein